MAQFDVPVPKQSDPSYLHYSKPVGDIPADTSVGKLFKGIGDAFEEGIKGVNKAAEEQATAVGVKAGESIQSDYGASVQAIHETMFPQDAATPDKATLTPTVGDTGYDESKVPQPVKDGVQAAQNIRAARDQGGTPGHIRETQYYADIYRKASELRAQWPGYRDYIDKGFEKATGISPNANAYIKSMLADINETLTKKNAAGEKVDTKLLDAAAAGNPIAAALYNNKKAGHIDDAYAINELSKSEFFKYQGQQDEAKLKRFDLNTKQRGQAAQDIISNTVPGQVHQMIEQHFNSIGLTPDKMQALIDKKIVLKPEEIDSLDKSLTQLEMQLRAQYNTLHTQNGVRQAKGEDYVKSMDESMHEFKMLHDAIRNPETGYLGDVTRANKYISDRMQNNIWNSDTPGAWFLKGTEIFTKMGGPNFSAAIMGPGGPGAEGLKPPNATELKAFMGNAMGGSQAPGLSSMKATLTAMNNVPGGAAPVDVQAYLRFPVTAITRPDVPDVAKVNILNHVFHGNENDWLKDLNDDAVVNGKQIVGKHAVFLGYTNPQFVKEIEKLSVHNPQLMNDYQQWVLRTFSNDLFSKDISFVSQMQGSNWNGVKLVWNTDTKPPRFEARPAPGNYPLDGMIGSGQAQSRADHANGTLRNLNYGIQAIHNVLGPNTTPTLMRLFGELGVDTTGTPTAGGMLLGALSARPPVTDSKKNQGTGGTDRTPAGFTNTHNQGTMNQINPATNTFPGQGAPHNAWRMEDSPGYQLGKQVGQRLGNVSADALSNWEKVMHPNYQSAMDKFNDLFGHK